MTVPSDANPFRRDREGFAVRLERPARALLGALASELAGVLTGATADDDPAVARLFPTAYPDDPARTMEFEHVAGEDLRRDRLERLQILSDSANARWLTEDQLLAWMGAINDARLVLGVRLGVTEETDARSFADDPDRARAWATYAYLSALLEAIVEALGDPLPERGSGA
ncbi:MAG: hypothetical protein KatS3mg013_1176 [Actinomycetota bacterium]|nr:MAG: hypothetical protein KatS3mg013_1176 [Actinomycetota bacterium]